jgi:predicted CXXCH cytochrome family protein
VKKKQWRGARLAVSGALALLAPVFLGGAHGAYIDCRLCHLDPAPDSAARDYFDYFVLAQRQHPTGIIYPPEDNEAYLRPTAFAGDIAFFDDNGNGIADAGEVQLFGAARQVECASCHREHGDAPPPAEPNMYLRMDGRALCMVCHRK